MLHRYPIFYDKVEHNDAQLEQQLRMYQASMKYLLHEFGQPYHRKLGIDATFRATGYIYNDENDFDVFKDALMSSIAMLG